MTIDKFYEGFALYKQWASAGKVIFTPNYIQP